jgi:hypothetical protein
MKADLNGFRRESNNRALQHPPLFWCSSCGPASTPESRRCWRPPFTEPRSAIRLSKTAFASWSTVSK